MSIKEFRMAYGDHIIKHSSVDQIIQKKLAPKLKIIFDIDHTLIFAIELNAIN
jgi:hypothetical protein